MGGLEAPNVTSLELLKALDSLPSLEAQISEAIRLCTHGARAEMILRWIVEKLKKSTVTGIKSGSWSLVGLAVRLLPPQRVAVLLGPMNIQAILLAILSDAQLPRAPLLEIQHFLELLLSIGSGPNGAPVKALISADGADASAFCGAWFNVVSDESSIIDADIERTQTQVNIGVALDVWALRRTQPVDDALFTRNCLVPVLALLSVIETASKTVIPKRRHHEMAVKPSDYHQQSLRSLLAKHCILPARAMYKRERDSMSVSSTQEPSHTTGSALHDIMHALESCSAETRPRILEAGIPLLLEVAMLSVPAPSPRLRDREQPWLENFFSALMEHACTAELSYKIRNSIIAKSLDKIRQHGSLSSETLSRLVQRCALPATNAEELTDLRLIAKAVAVNVDIFTNSSLAELLFDTISVEAIAGRGNLELTTFIREQILGPVMTAFARGRGLSRFVTLWKKQLLRQGNDTETGVWDQLSQPFADLLESTFSHEEILELCVSIHSPVAAIAISKDAKDLEQLDANLVLLNAVLCGVRNVELLDQIYSSLNDSMVALIRIASAERNASPQQLGKQYWICLTNASRLWFPVWSSRQLVYEASHDDMHALLANESFQAALTSYLRMESGTLKTSQTSKTAKGTELNVATTYGALSTFKEREDVRAVSTTTVESPANVPSRCLHALTGNPDLSALLCPPKRNTVEILPDVVDSDPQHSRLTLISQPATLEVRDDLTTVLVGRLQTELNEGNLNQPCRNLMNDTARLLELDLTTSEQDAILSAFSKAFQRSTHIVKGLILDELSRRAEVSPVAYLSLLRNVIPHLTKEDTEIMQGTQTSVLLSHCASFVTASESGPTIHCALRTVSLILREKPFMVSQYGIEHVMSTIQIFATDSAQVEDHYIEICQIMMLILVQYRPRVQDRLHLIVTLVQSLLSPLFNVPGRKESVTSSDVRHAAILTRILMILCDRRPERRHRKNASELVDEARKIQARTGQYVQYILHRYCALILTGSIAEDMRQLLMPGIWAVIEAIEVSGTEGMKALNAAMNNSERAVFRSVYEDWKRTAKWEGL